MDMSMKEEERIASPSDWDHVCCSAANKANTLGPGVPITLGRGDTNKLIIVLTWRMKNEPADSILGPRG